MTTADNKNFASLLDWNDSLNPLRVDIVGDFAGKGFFGIHGESLVSHCIAQAKVDYAGGFQLLHAVHAVETFLSRLKDRGCNFHLLWFDSQEELSVPYEVPEKYRHRYLLTRQVLIEHFRSLDLNGEPASDRPSGNSASAAPMSFVFPSINSDQFGAYIEEHYLHFILCSRGGAIHDKRKMEHLVTMLLFAQKRYSLGFIDDIEFRNNPSAVTEKHVAAFLVHITLLGHGEIEQRSCEDVTWVVGNDDHRFLEDFSKAATSLIRQGTIGYRVAYVDWRLCDLVDGRLFLHVLHRLDSVNLVVDMTHYVDAIKTLTDISESNSRLQIVNLQQSQPNAFVLTFRHPVLDPYVEEVKLETDDNWTEHATDSKVFQELAHWSNATQAVDSKQHTIRKKADVRALKRNQRFMADTVAYSASLTNASGKNINPERIVAQNVTDKKPQLWREQLSRQQASKAAKKGTKKGRKDALEVAKDVQETKRESRLNAIITFVSSQCKDFDRESSLVKRYFKAHKYFSSLSQPDLEAIGAEVSMYLCDTLARMLVKPPLGDAALSILAMLRAQVLETQSLPLTTGTAEQLRHLNIALDIAVSTTHSRSLNERPLPFLTNLWKTSKHIKFPTSAGKTFISFYAMKKILQASNDDVLVYVAPTKALVNQIAAEIQARFTKLYHQEGRSVWAIHTRDYRINNPYGCQILVTVPHILQIMMLAPSNAQKPDSWARRVKRIIFDEVHCIGKAEDGIIWEQLLLLAPCLIIALSATVGNPTEFRDWLAATQKAKGFDLEMVVHSSRYSDLRKFIYQPPREQDFEGFKTVERLPIPGLDSEGGESDRFIFVHPVSSIIHKTKERLEDVNLEPRDCLRLWKTMNARRCESYDIDQRLDPHNALPENYQERDLETNTGAIRRKNWTGTTFSLLNDLRSHGALPAIVFNYDRVGCELILSAIMETLNDAETTYRKSGEWAKILRDFQAYNEKKLMESKIRPPVNTIEDRDDGTALDGLDYIREATNKEFSIWDSFDPDAPIDRFSFADSAKITKPELEKIFRSLEGAVRKPFLDALRRGLGVHHAGMNRRYRQAVEILFRKGFLTAVMATGTLALGINMPCKTVVFAGDSVFLTALNYRQASGRAGRRGFDLLGNVVFHGIPPRRAMEIMSSRLPDLRGQFAISATLILRLFSLMHGTGDSEYAVKAVESLLTQTRLYLGGPSSQMSVKHHLRFSIDYLRRQHLLSATGVPLNFSSLVGHLYFTENTVFVLHSLLKDGYLHELCAKIDSPGTQKDVLLELLTVLCHLFSRIPCTRYKSKKWLEEVVHRSPSVVLLPRLPQRAETVLRNHNKETLDIFQTYVRRFVNQHLNNTRDDILPFTKRRVGPSQGRHVDLSTTGLPIRPTTSIRSPFAALSGFTDDVDSIHELCETARAGVFLVESSIAYIPIYPDETGGTPFNAYILDFFKHGDLKALVRDNGIKQGDVWFLLKDFSLALATITASLGSFLNKNGAEFDDTAMIDVQDVGDLMFEEEEEADDEQHLEEPNLSHATDNQAGSGSMSTRRVAKNKKHVAESWMDEEESGDESVGSSSGGGIATESSTLVTSWDDDGGAGLLKVHKAFKILQYEFEEKFRNVWA
ncbi:dead deah box helicase [Colletotrichum plurivorum]|uniref:Dead deah box helicase n=1 Tax=Colletotrichum plurivorum TaxID=2175906 RepID=A0A8H6NIX4_9PEZI|nr:dead deah box helicase [Colletotrichum plurivorum]